MFWENRKDLRGPTSPYFGIWPSVQGISGKDRMVINQNANKSGRSEVGTYKNSLRVLKLHGLKLL